MKRRWAICLVACALLIKELAFAEGLDDLKEKAQTAWRTKDFQSYAKVSSEIGNTEPRFGNLFNAALGQYMAGASDLALKRIKTIESMNDLDKRQIERIAELKATIEKHQAAVQSVRQRSSIGSVTLSNAPSATEQRPCPNAGRSADCLGLKPEEQQYYIEELKRQALINNGYIVPPRVTITPE